MADIANQASFNAGEWAPNLNARVDLQKYRSGAALLENFFVDYRGGASTRAGTQYIIQAYKSATQVRIINFQASFNVGYVIEIGNGYMRFIYNGGMILENAFSITAATQANPCVISVPGNNFATGDWIYINSVGGMIPLDNRFFSVLNVSGSNVTLGDLNGNNLDSTGFPAYTTGGNAARVYTIASPYTSADDLRLIKFAQSINQMILCHPNHPPYVLTLVTATDWTLLPIVIGSTSVAPTNVIATTTLGFGSVYYSYGVTSIDVNGQESSLSVVAALGGKQDIRTTAGTNQISWTAAQGAVGYNVYESNVSYFGVIPYGVQYGFIGTCKGTNFIDSNISADYSQTPPISQNPFTGSGVSTVTVTAHGSYTAVPTITFVGTCTIPATGIAVLQVQGTPTITSGGTGFVVNDTIQFPGGIVMQVLGVTAGAITSWAVVNPGYVASGSVPSSPSAQTNTTGSGTGATLTATWGVGEVIPLTSGAGYLSPPSVNFSAGAATATTTLSATSNGNPTVPSFSQQRLVLAAPPGSPQTFYMSKPGSYYNFDISDPSRADDAITGTLVSGTLNTIKAIVSSTSGMLILTDKASWLVNGGSSGSAITPSAIVANAQSFVGANDVPPIVANYDVLYVQSKGSGVRDLAFNIYFNVFTGTDISVLSSHLFYGYNILEWAWAEQPFYDVWAVRDDGQLLSLTFLKEQDFIGWAHHLTTNGLFKSVTTVTESTATAGNVDAVYTVVQRNINGVSVQYIERIAERIFPNGVKDAWCVDSALQYSGLPVSTFKGFTHLAGQVVTGLADGVIIPPFTMPASGQFTLATPASKVTVGLPYTCKLQTLALEVGEPSVQGKVKKINYVDVRVSQTLGLSIGPDFNHLTPMKDLVRGNVSSMLTGQQSQIVTDLVTGDARTFLSPTYTVPGQYCIEQSNPYPSTILGVFPSYTIGDDR